MKSWFIQGSWHELQLLRKSSYWRASDATLQDSSSWDLYEVKRENSLQFCFVLFFLKMEVGIFLNSWKERKKIVIVFFSLRDDYWMNFWGNTEVLIWIIGVNQWFFFFLFWITVLNIDFYSFSDFFLFFLMKCYTPVFNCK